MFTPLEQFENHYLSGLDLVGGSRLGLTTLSAVALLNTAVLFLLLWLGLSEPRVVHPVGSQFVVLSVGVWDLSYLVGPSQEQKFTALFALVGGGLILLFLKAVTLDPPTPGGGPDGDPGGDPEDPEEFRRRLVSWAWYLAGVATLTGGVVLGLYLVHRSYATQIEGFAPTTEEGRARFARATAERLARRVPWPPPQGDLPPVSPTSPRPPPSLGWWRLFPRRP